MTYSIRIESVDGGTYKLIGDLEWPNVPPLAILTGLNGAGKTQLLEVMAYSLTKTWPPNSSIQGLQVNVTLSGLSVEPEDVSFVPSAGRFSGGGAVTLGSIESLKRQTKNRLRNLSSNDYTQASRFHRLRRRLGGLNPSEVKDQQLEELLPNSFDFVLDDTDVTAGLAVVCLAHWVRELVGVKNEREGRPSEPLRPAPWEVVNQALVVRI